jgi:hypothetical protein
VNQISTYRPLAGVVTGNRTVPPTSDALAATGSSASSDVFPTRTWTSAPTGAPRTSRRLLTVTVSPMSSRRPVPDCRLPNSGDAYQWLYQACPSPPLMTPGASAG